MTVSIFLTRNMKKKAIIFLLALFLVPFVAKAGTVEDILKQGVDKMLEMAGKDQLISDIPKSHPNFYAITWLIGDGDITGYPDGTFKPDNPINRAELMKMVTGTAADGQEQKYSNCFPDVKDEWYAKYICYGKEQGWVKGYPDSTFKPANNVNRAEAIKIIISSSLTQDQIPNPTPAQMALQMPSDFDPNAWYAGFLRFAMVKELLDGQHVTVKGDTYQYYPAGNMTRKEVAEMLWRIGIYISERDKYAEVMVAATCYWVQNQATLSKDELNQGVVKVFTDNLFTEEEMNSLTVKYQDDTALQAKIQSDTNTQCGSTQTLPMTQELPVGDPEGATQGSGG